MEANTQSKSERNLNDILRAYDSVPQGDITSQAGKVRVMLLEIYQDLQQKYRDIRQKEELITEYKKLVQALEDGISWRDAQIAKLKERL